MSDLVHLWRQDVSAGRPAHPGGPAHLLHVFPSFDVGGSQMRLATLLGCLGQSFRHTIVALDGHWNATSLLPPDADAVMLQPPPVGRCLPWRLLSIRTALRAIAPDVLLTYNWGAIEWALANNDHVPHLHHEDGFGPEESKRQIPRRVRVRHLALRRSLLAVPSRILSDIAVTRWGIGPDRVHHIPNGIMPRDTADARRKPLGIDVPPDRCRIVWTGALRPEKNPMRLLRAFAPLAGRAVLLFVGDGPEREPLQREASRLGLIRHLHFLGRRDDARDIMMQADILALSSDTEQMPFAVLEAMDAGLPVASVDVGDIREMVALENRDFIVARRSDALSGALNRLVGDTELRMRVGNANRKKVRSVYHASDMAVHYRALFDTALQKGGACLAARA